VKASFVAQAGTKTGKMAPAAQRIDGFVALDWAEFDKKGVCARRAQRIHGFVAQVWAKNGKMAFFAQRIRRFCARSVKHGPFGQDLWARPIPA
jgi:hypothetical protein